MKGGENREKVKQCGVKNERRTTDKERNRSHKKGNKLPQKETWDKLHESFVSSVFSFPL